MRKIDISTPTYPNKFALVDDEDYHWLICYKWYCAQNVNGTFYARYKSYAEEKPKELHMHRLIMKAKMNELVDHKDFNGLNNQKENLRLCTKAQNNIHSGPKITNVSGYKGVIKDARNKNNIRWRAQITIDYKAIHLGSFSTKEEAAKAYNKAAYDAFGEFAYLNKVEEK